MRSLLIANHPIDLFITVLLEGTTTRGEEHVGLVDQTDPFLAPPLCFVMTLPSCML
jgi:hypothetical protein